MKAGGKGLFLWVLAGVTFVSVSWLGAGWLELRYFAYAIGASVAVLIVSLFWPSEKQEKETAVYRLSDISKIWTDPKPEKEPGNPKRVQSDVPETIEEAPGENAPEGIGTREKDNVSGDGIPVKADTESTSPYENPDVQQFYDDWVADMKAGPQRAVIENLLTMIDRDGDCPSVAGQPTDEHNRNYMNSFDKLRGISLREHLLAVARETAGLMQSRLMIPDALIVGLAHDLGKMPGIAKQTYITGDHPVRSIIVLNKTPEFGKITTQNDIRNAIEQHHLLHPDGMLAIALKTADRTVRQEEISRFVELSNPVEETPAEKPDLPPKSFNVAGAATSSTGREDRGSVDRMSVEDAAAPPAPKGPDASSPARSSVAERLSVEEFGLVSMTGGAIDLDRLLSAIKERINIFNNGRWSVLSTRDGMVLCNTDAFWREIEALVEVDRESVTEKLKKETCRKVVERLDKEKNAVFSNLFKPGFHTTQFVIVPCHGARVYCALIPLKASAFNLVPSQMEELKSAELKAMTNKIMLYRKKEKA